MDPSVTHREGFFAAKDNLRLYWQAFTPPEPRAVVGLIHGYAEHSNRHLPLIEHLTSRGFAVHAFDYRGHGQADGRRGHCDDFTDFLDDLELFVQRVVADAPGQEFVLLGHSHGGLMLAHHLLHRSDGVRAAIFSSPFLRLGFAPPATKVFFTRLLGKIVPWLPVKNVLRPEQLTRDLEVQRATARDPLYNQVVTPRWFDCALRAQDEALARASELTVPALVLVAEGDVVASPGVMKTFFERLGSAEKELRTYPGAQHELFNEIPETRTRAFSDLDAFLDRRFAPRAPSSER